MLLSLCASPGLVPLVSKHLSASTLSIDTEDSLRDAARLLQSARITGAPVADGSSLAGILSRNSLLHAIAEIPSEADLDAHVTKIQERPVWEVMTENPTTITPTATIIDAAKLMAERKLNRLMVKAKYGGLLGVVSSTDIVMSLLCGSRQGFDTAPYVYQCSVDECQLDHSEVDLPSSLVEKHMATRLYYVTPDMPLETAAELLRATQVTGAPVLDENKKLVGVLSRFDLLKALLSIPADLSDDDFASELQRIKAEPVRMHESCVAAEGTPITVKPTVSLLDAAKLMAEHKFNRLVVTREGQDAGAPNALCGIISSIDVVFSMLGCASMDDDPEEELDEELLEKRMGNLYQRGIY